MPLTVSVGLSRKAAKDYRSAGASITLTAELDPSLLARPGELQRQVAGLYAQAAAALDRQVPPPPPPGKPDPGPTAPASPAPSNGAPDRDHARGNGDGPAGVGTRGGPMTPAQRRAIDAAAARAGVDPRREALDVHGADLGRLSLRQASELIDHLRGRTPRAAAAR